MPKNKKPEKKVKVIDYAADENFNPIRTMISIEHTEECPIFKMKAIEFLAYCEEHFPDRIFVLSRNKEPPRDGTFEISMSQSARTPMTLLWSGMNKGPPRRDKFPIFQDLLPEITTLIKKMYVDPNAKVHISDSFEDLDADNDNDNN